MTSQDEAKLSFVNPMLASKIRSLAEMMDLAGNPIKVITALRTWADQAKLYAQGRTVPGQIVTDSPPGYSWHEMGLACDVAPISLLAETGWEPNNPLWPD